MAEEKEPQLASAADIEKLEVASNEAQSALSATPAVNAVTPAPLSRVEMARSLGFDVPDGWDDERLNGSLTQFRELASLGHRFQTNPQEFASYFAPSQEKQALGQQTAVPQQQATQAAADAFANAWVSPPDASILAQVEFDEDSGVARGKNAFVSPQVVQQVNDYLRRREEFSAKFQQNPVKYVHEHIREPLLNEMRQLIRAEYEQQQAASQMQRLEADVNEKSFAKDASGSWLVDPATGQRSLSEWGQAYARSAEIMERVGYRDAMEATRWAMAEADRAVAGKQVAAPVVQQQQVTPQQVSQQRKDEFLAGAVQKPNGYGTSHPSVEEPVRLTEAQLESLFIDRARAAGVL